MKPTCLTRRFLHEYFFLSATPSKPSITSVTFNGSTVVVRWRPGYDGGYPQKMEVWYRLFSDDDYKWSYSPRLSASVTSYRIPGLQAGKPYLFSVRGVNREGLGLFSEMVEAKGLPPELNRDPKKSGEKIRKMFIPPQAGVLHLSHPLPLGRRGERHWKRGKKCGGPRSPISFPGSSGWEIFTKTLVICLLACFESRDFCSQFQVLYSLKSIEVTLSCQHEIFGLGVSFFPSTFILIIFRTSQRRLQTSVK